MKKRTTTVNKMNNRLYKSIMESVTPEIRKALREAEKEDTEKEDEEEVDEQALNELFGFGSSIKKPEKSLSLENTDDENADLVIAWMAYYMSQASNNVQKGIEGFMKEFGDVVKKAPMVITKGVLKFMSAGAKAAVYSVSTIAAVILGSISLLVRLTVSGVEGAKEALVSLYTNIAKGIAAFYKSFKENSEKMATGSKDTLTKWLGILSAALMACANKIQDAAKYFAETLKKILADAKDKVDGAVLITKTWLQTKSEAVKGWISDTAGDIRKTVIEAWNAMDKKVRKTYNDIAAKLEEWMGDIKDLVNSLETKISDTADKAKNFTIDKKDKALIWGIQKGVKGLSDKYSEDQVVALVRKCYNEALIPINGKYRINESYFYDAKTRQRRLYESRRMNRRYKRL